MLNPNSSRKLQAWLHSVSHETGWTQSLRTNADSFLLTRPGMFMGGAIVLSVGQLVFATKLKDNLARYAPGVDSTIALSAPSNIQSSYSSEQASQVVTAYVKTLDTVFLLGVAGGES